MKDRNQSILKIFTIGCVVLLGGWWLSADEVEDYSEKYAGIDLTANIEGIGREDTYSKYLEKYEDETKNVTTPMQINLMNTTGNTTGVEHLAQYEGQSNIAMLSDESYAEWEFEVAQSGLYNIQIEYYPVPDSGIDIERICYINGEVPFVGADTIVLSRLWGDATEVFKDNQGNEIRPSQIELPDWNTSYFKDYMGYEVAPYAFYFDAGTNTLALEATKEALAVKSITLVPIGESIDYAQYLVQTGELPVDDASKTFEVVIQGEDSTLRNSPSLYGVYDRSSPATVPYNISNITLNMIGGYAYRIANQWIEWEFEVPADGYYYIDIKSRQSYQRGFVSNRAVYIDDEVPFEELGAIPFYYSTEWEMITLGTGDEDCMIYLEEGSHTIRMEVTLGEMGNILTQLEDSVFRLNAIYRKILVLTGSSPDPFRDYRIDKVYPEVMDSMLLESQRLYKIIDDIIEYTGQKASQVASAQTLAMQLEHFVDDPYTIPSTMTNFQANISALGTSILAMAESPLDIDSITIRGVDVEKDEVDVSFLDGFIHESASFLASFFTDYNSVGNVYEGMETVEVWLLSGRDQSTILKNMIDDTFVIETGIPVNVKLVEAGSLLNAVVAGTGPDIVLSIGQGEPVNYALRNAVEDLTQFDDLDEILERFAPSAYAPFGLEGGLYALPETQAFDVLFYRQDILDELELEVPNTWDELIGILPIIQQNNMNLVIPSAMTTANPDPSAFLTLLYQHGGSLYSDDGKTTLLDGPSSVAAFEMYTKFFTHYKVPQYFDFVNRFRSGETPIGIQPFGMYNTLSVFAPEIRGLWDFALLPGIEQEDGTIDRTGYGSSSASMMLKQEDDALRDSCWEFMKWWTDVDTQVRFGREMESVLGPSARYATANIAAFDQLAWSKNQKDVLQEQRDWIRGTEQIAGGYYTFRHITNAVRSVVLNSTDARETLLDYTRTINEEIEKKRLEFNLDVD